MSAEAQQGQLSFWGREDPPKPTRRIPAAPPPVVDYAAWVRHESGCDVCQLASRDLELIKSGEVIDDPCVPCESGIRLLPTEQIDLGCGYHGIHRSLVPTLVRRLLDHADRIHGDYYENRHLGVAWHGPILDREAG